MSEKNERVHALVNDGPWLGMSEAFDAHMGAVGAGIKEGTLVKILGTSTCDLMIAPTSKPLADIPGVCGIVNFSPTVLP